MNDGKLKPLFLVKPGTMSRRDIMRAERHAGVCIVECAEPDATRYSEAPPMANLDEQARAALSLMRMVINSPTPDFKRADLTKWFVQELLSWKRPDEVQRVKPVTK